MPGLVDRLKEPATGLGGSEARVKEGPCTKGGTTRGARIAADVVRLGDTFVEVGCVVLCSLDSFVDAVAAPESAIASSRDFVYAREEKEITLGREGRREVRRSG